MKTLLISSIISLFSISAFAENPYKSIRLGMSSNQAKKECIAKTIESKIKMAVEMLSCNLKKTQEYITFYIINDKVGRTLIVDIKNPESFLKKFLNTSWKIIEENKQDSENGHFLYTSAKENKFMIVQVVNSLVMITYSTLEYEKHVTSIQEKQLHNDL